MKFRVFAPALPFLAAACSTPDYAGRADLTTVRGEALPVPSRADLVPELRAYLVSPNDELAIDVFGIPDLTREVQVDSSGQIALPLAGTMQVGGLTSAEVAALVTTRLRAAHVRNPSVAVNVTDATGQTFTVAGEVIEPGLYPIAGKQTLSRAIARAKGVTEFAKRDRVVLLRTVGDRDYAALYDLRAIDRGLYADPEVFPNDVISVAESRGRRIFKDVIQGSGLLTTPLIVALQRR